MPLERLWIAPAPPRSAPIPLHHPDIVRLVSAAQAAARIAFRRCDWTHDELRALDALVDAAAALRP